MCFRHVGEHQVGTVSRAVRRRRRMTPGARQTCRAGPASTSSTRIPSRSRTPRTGPSARNTHVGSVPAGRCRRSESTTSLLPPASALCETTRGRRGRGRAARRSCGSLVRSPARTGRGAHAQTDRLPTRPAVQARPRRPSYSDRGVLPWERYLAFAEEITVVSRPSRSSPVDAAPQPREPPAGVVPRGPEPQSSARSDPPTTESWSERFAAPDGRGRGRRTASGRDGLGRDPPGRADGDPLRGRGRGVHVGRPLELRELAGQGLGAVLVVADAAPRPSRALRPLRHEEFLQRRYPSVGRTAAVSDVELPQLDPDVLERRLARIASRPRPFVIGTIGALYVRYKGFETAFAALAAVRGRLPPVRVPHPRCRRSGPVARGDRHARVSTTWSSSPGRAARAPTSQRWLDDSRPRTSSRAFRRACRGPWSRRSHGALSRRRLDGRRHSGARRRPTRCMPRATSTASLACWRAPRRRPERGRRREARRSFELPQTYEAPTLDAARRRSTRRSRRRRRARRRGCRRRRHRAPIPVGVPGDRRPQGLGALAVRAAGGHHRPARSEPADR